jgi:hypothetical protein
MMQRAVMLAAESLKVLEPQLKDGTQIQDVKVGSKQTLKQLHHGVGLRCQNWTTGAKES